MQSQPNDIMMTSSNGYIFRITGPLWIPRTKASDAKPWSFLWSAPWINGWVTNREDGDLRRNHALYDVIVMMYIVWDLLFAHHVHTVYHMHGLIVIVFNGYIIYDDCKKYALSLMKPRHTFRNTFRINEGLGYSVHQSFIWFV